MREEQQLYLEAIGDTLATHRLLAHARNHLSNVDGGPLAATLTHDEGGVVPVQRLHTQLQATG